MFNRNQRSINKEFTCTECDFQYYNITIPHKGDINDISLATQIRNNSIPILENPQEYKLSISRLSIPLSDIPIFLAEPITNGSNQLIYTVSLEYNGDIQTVSLTYISTSIGILPSSPRYYYVYTYTLMVEMANIALAQAFNNLSAPPVGSEPPYFTFDPITQLFSLNAQSSFYDETLTQPIKVYGNSSFLDKFDGILGNFNFNNTNPDLLFQYRIFNKKNNIEGSNYFMKQDYNTLSRWNSLRSIQITSNLPINNEFVDTDYDDITGKATKSENILRDFSIFYNEFNSIARTTVDFQVDEFNYIDLKGLEPIRDIQVNIYWLDKKGVRRPILIRYDEAAHIKLMFKKKDLI